jgi:hypothetical protein
MARNLYARVKETEWSPERADPGQMPPPRILLIEESEREDALLIGYESGSEFSGDTWHESVEEAKLAAADRYGVALEEWQDVPPDAEGAVAFVRGLVS